MAEGIADFVCEGCAVRAPWEHKCHGAPCGCEDCSLECDRCGRVAQGWDDEGWGFTEPHPDDGMQNVYCPTCDEVITQAENELTDA